MINNAVFEGHQATDKDEYQHLRNKLKYYRKRFSDLNLLKNQSALC